MDQQNNVRIDVVGSVDGLSSTARDAERELDRLKNSAAMAGESMRSGAAAGELLRVAGGAVAGVAATAAGGIAAWALAQVAATLAIKDTADEVGKLAQRMGESVTSVSELRHIFNMAGASADEMAGLMKSLETKSQDAAKGTGQAAAAYKAMGVSVLDTNGELKDGRVLLEEVADKIAGYRDGAAKAALVQDALGGSWVKMIPLLNSGAEGFREASKEAHDLGVVFDEKLTKQAAELNDNLTRIKTAAEGAKIALGSDLMAAVRNLSEEFIQGVKAAGGFWAALNMGATLNPFKSNLDNLASVRADLAKMESDQKEYGYLDEQRWNRKQAQLRYLLAMQADIDRKGFAALSDGLPETKDDRPKAPTPLKKDKESSGISDYERLIQTLNEKIAVETTDLMTVEKLTAAEKDFAKYQADLASGRLDLANAEKQVAAAFWETYLQRAKANQEEKDQKKGNDLIREYERKNALDLQQIQRGAELAAMSERERSIAEAVYKAEKAGGDVRDKIIQQLPEGTARTLALARANEILAEYLDKVAESSAKSYDDQRTFKSGWNNALKSYVDEVNNSAKSAQSIFNGMADGMADALVRFAQTGKISFSGLANSIIADILKIQAKAAVSGIMGYLTNAVGAYFGGGATATAGPSAAAGGGSWLGGGQSLNAMGAHGGALVGSEATFMRSVSPALFAGAPRFHGGGIVGDEVPAILKPGEGVFTEGQMKALGGGGNTTVIINNQSGSQASTQERSDGRGGKIIEVLIEQVKAGIASDISRGSGAVPSALQSSYGLSRTAGAY